MNANNSFLTIGRRIKAVLMAFIFAFVAVGAFLPAKQVHASSWTPNYTYLAGLGTYGGKTHYADCSTYGGMYSSFNGNDDYAYVMVNAANFPDEAFRNRLISDCGLTQVYVSATSDSAMYTAYVIPKSSLNLYEEFSMQNVGISDLTGIQYFYNLKKLDVRGNSISDIDLSYNTLLTNLNVSGNSLTSLDVSGLTALTVLRCNNNSISTLSLPSGANFSILDIGNNALTGALNVKAQNLLAQNNGLTGVTLNHIAGSDTFYVINLNGNELSSFEIPASTKIDALLISDNNLTGLDITPATEITILDVSKNNITGDFNLNLSGSSNLYRNVSNNHITSFSGMSWSGTNSLILLAGNNNLTSIPSTVGSNGYYDFSGNDFSDVDIVLRDAYLGGNLDASQKHYYNITNTSYKSFTDSSGGVYSIATDTETESYKGMVTLGYNVIDDVSVPYVNVSSGYMNKISGVTTPTTPATVLDSDAYVSSMTNDGFVDLSLLGKTSNTWNTELTLRSDPAQKYKSFCIDIGKKCRLNNGYWSSGEYTETPAVNKIISAYKDGVISYKEAQCLIWAAVAGYTSESDMTTILTDIESTDIAGKVSAVSSASPVTVYFWTNVYGTANYQRLVSELPPTNTTEITVDDDSTWYHVTYDANWATEGTAPVDTTDYQEQEFFTVKSGAGLKKGPAVFSGWQSSYDGTIYAAGALVQITNSDITLYAQYVLPDEYHVTYDANGGENPPVDTSDYVSGASVTVLSQEGMTKSGLTFNGWNTESDGSGTDYGAGDTFSITADITLYAVWSGGATVTYLAGDSTEGTVPVDNTLYVEGDTITVLGNTGSLKKTGYFFKGWKETVSNLTYYTEDDIDDEIYVTTPLRTYTFTPVWEQGYKIVYDGNGADGGAVPEDPNYHKSGDTAIALGNSGYLTKSDDAENTYAFDGWNTKADGTGTPITVGSTIYPAALDGDSDHIVTLYAVWKATPIPAGTFVVEVPAIVRLQWMDIDETTGQFFNAYHITCDGRGLTDETYYVRLKDGNNVLTLNNGENLVVGVDDIEVTKIDGRVTYQVRLSTGVVNTADYLGKEYFTDCIFEFGEV